MNFITEPFRSQCKSEHNQVQRKKITRDMCKSDSILRYLQDSTVFK